LIYTFHIISIKTPEDFLVDISKQILRFMEIQRTKNSQKHLGKRIKLTGRLWLMSITLATQEAEIRRISVESQPRK
jgi:hypothetical protein